MNTFVMWVGFLLVAALTALFAVPHFVDWNDYRGVFETQASRILGRDVRVGGDVNVRFLPKPYVRFERMRIAEGNEAGFGGRSFIRAESFTMWLSVPPLLKGILEAKEVELERPALRLAVDRAGRGNWRTFKIQSGTLPFVPAGISLRAVKITDGTVTFDSADENESIRLDGLNGTLSARNLSGPYRFDGHANWNDDKREIKFASFEAPRNAPETVPIRLQVRTNNLKDTYVVEGSFDDLLGIPKFIGALKADIALPTKPGLKSNEKDNKVANEARPHLTLLAKVEGSGTSAELANLVASFEDVGQPQLLTGQVKVDYGLSRALNIELSSRWLDFDRLLRPYLAQQDQASPLSVGQLFIPSMGDLLPGNFATTAKIEIEQIQLGQKAVSGVRAKVTKTDGKLVLNQLLAGLPGGARLKLAGKFNHSRPTGEKPTTTPVKDTRFTGDMFLGGPSMIKTVRWATQNEEHAKGLTDGSFSVASSVTFGKTLVSLNNIDAQYSGRPISGSLIWRDDSQQSLDVDIVGHEFDSRWLGVEQITLETFRDWFQSLSPVKIAAVTQEGDNSATSVTDANIQSPALSAKGLERTSLRLKIGRLINGPDILRDVEGNIKVAKDGLTLSNLKFATNKGLNISLAGTAAHGKDAIQGTFNWEFSTRGSAGVTQLARMLDYKEIAAHPNRLLSTVSKMTPLDLAGTVNIGKRSKTAVDIQADGLVRDGRGILTAQIDGGLDQWRTTPVDVTLDLENTQISHLLSLLVDYGVPEARAPQRQGRATIKAVGTPSRKLLGAVQLTADGLQAGFGGHMLIGEDGIDVAEGQININGDDVREVLQITGIPMAPGATKVPIAGKITVVADDGTWVYWPENMKIAGQVVTGSLAVVPNSEPGSSKIAVNGKIGVTRASFANLLTPALKAAPTDVIAGGNPPSSALANTVESATEEPALATPSETSEQWPSLFTSEQFDIASLAPLSGKLEVRFGVLELASGLVMNDANANILFQNGDVQLESLTGSAAGGQLIAKATLSRARAGVKLNGQLQLQNANLADLVPGFGANGAAPVAGTLSLAASATGQAFNPNDLVSSLQGKGEVILSEVIINGLAPGAVTSAANEALVDDKKLEGDALRNILLQRLTRGEVAIPASKIPLKIIDGNAQISAFSASGPSGTLRNKTSIDLSSLIVDSSWQIKPAVEKQRPRQPDDLTPVRPPKAWPGVNVAFVGPMTQLGQLQPKIAASDLERELAVRRIQKNVDELERLRREDERRAAEEKARREERAAERARRAAQEDAQPTASSTDESNPELSTGENVVSEQELTIDENGNVIETPKTPEKRERRRKKKRSPWASEVYRRYRHHMPYPSY